MDIAGWNERSRPARLERRLEFPDYEATRVFLDRAADLSEREGLYPDMSFGRTYVNITVHADEGAEALGERQRRLAEGINALLAS